MAARETEKNRAIQLDAFRQAGFENADLRLLDENAVNEMRAAVGVRLFDELYEDSVFEVTERLGAVEIALAEESLDRAARLAAGLAPASRKSRKSPMR